MSKTPRVEFRPKRIAEGDWQIEAHFPGAEVRYITGLTDKADIDDLVGWQPQNSLAPLSRLREMTNGDVGAVRILRAILGAVSSLRRRLHIR